MPAAEFQSALHPIQTYAYFVSGKLSEPEVGTELLKIPVILILPPCLDFLHLAPCGSAADRLY